MSLITRCPACGTMFKVVPDQLRISDGWVRCGHCSEVFDASLHLQGEGATATQPGELTATQSQKPAPSQNHAPFAPVRSDGRPRNITRATSGLPVRDPIDPGIDSRIDSLIDTPDSTADADLFSEQFSQPFASSLTTEVGSSLSPGAPDSRQLREAADGLFEGPLDRPFVLQMDEPIPHNSRPGSLTQGTGDDAHPSRYGEPSLNDLSFVRDARRQAFWSSRPLRIALVGVCVLLALLLATQFAIQDRDKLASSRPQLRPLLSALCEQLHCLIGAPKQIEAIAIDSSTFKKLRPDAYRLSVTLKNSGALEVAMPALELTLTDAQDQAVVRRVLLPGELQPVKPVIGAQGDWSGSVAFAVTAGAVNSRVAGYRLLVFYP